MTGNELDRLDLGAVLFRLAAALRLLVDVELAFDAVELAVEQVDEGPQQVAEIVLDPPAYSSGDCKSLPRRLSVDS